MVWVIKMQIFPVRKVSKISLEKDNKGTKELVERKKKVKNVTTFEKILKRKKDAYQS